MDYVYVHEFYDAEGKFLCMCMDRFTADVYKSKRPDATEKLVKVARRVSDA